MRYFVNLCILFGGAHFIKKAYVQSSMDTDNSEISNKDHRTIDPFPSKFEDNFCTIAAGLQKIETDDTRDKLSSDSPLGKFLSSNDVIFGKLVTYDKDSALERHSGNYKEYVAVEIEVIFASLEFFKFTIQEIVLAPPNPKDEDNYFFWYPYKSQLRIFVDSDENLFNLVMMIERHEIRVEKRFDKSSLKDRDINLIDALKKAFDTVKIQI